MITQRFSLFYDLPNPSLPSFVALPSSDPASSPISPSDGVGGPSRRAVRVRFEEPQRSLDMQVRPLPVSDYNSILQAVAISWPQNRRAVIDGKGICLGATYHLDGPKVAGATRQARMEDLCRVVNRSLSALFPPSDGIVWGSLQQIPLPKCTETKTTSD